MNENFFNFTLHKPYLHVYVLAIMLLIFGLISLVDTIKNNSTAHVSNLKANFYFVFSQVFLFIATCLPFFLAGNGKFIFDKWIDDNFFAAYLSGIILLLTFLAKFYIYENLQRLPRLSLFYTTLYLALLGLILICISQHILFIFFGLTLTTFAIYLMLGLNRESPKASQVSVQFYTLSIISLALLAFGLSFLYGGTGSFLTTTFHKVITETDNIYRPFLEISTIFIIAAIAFQFGVAPFHQWVISLYKQCDYPVAMIVMNITKIGIFALAMRLIITTLFSIADYWKWLILVIAISSIFLGFIGLIAQKSFRKFIAYSTIANLGFVMLALFAVVEIRAGGDFVSKNANNAISSDLLYLIYYQFTNVAVFAFAWVLAKDKIPSDDIDNFKGLSVRYPWFALMFTTLMLSLAGIPPFLGFWAKLAIIQALLSSNHPVIITLAVLVSLFGAYFYLRMIKLMYFDSPKAGHDNQIVLTKPFRFVLSMHCLLLIILGLFPAVLVQTAFLIMT